MYVLFRNVLLHHATSCLKELAQDSNPLTVEICDTHPG